NKATGAVTSTLGGSLSNQLRASGQAASQDYAPTPASGGSNYQPAEISPPPSAVPMPIESAATPPSSASELRSTLAPIEGPLPRVPTAIAPEGSSSDEPVPAEATDADTTHMRSILKRTKTTAPNEPARPVITPVNPPAARRVAPSSRRALATPPSSAMPARRVTGGVAGIDTRSITQLAVSGRSPSLRVDLAGPQGITVGKPASYVVSIVNEGEAAAQEVQLRLDIPGFVTVANSQASSGEALLHADGRLLWTLPAVDARAHETLRLELVASEGQAFDLGVEWACRPSSTQASIEVKQAQLQLSLAGPADMTFGDEKPFTLSVANPGNGDAENVVINLSSGQNRRQQIEVGTLPAGEQKELQVTIVASEAGEMEIHAQATGDGDLVASAAGKVLVRKAELAVIVEGPALTGAGAEALYRVIVQNVGNATADNVQLAAAFPAAATYVGGVEGATSASGSLKWKLSALPAGSERAYELRLQLSAAGSNRIAVQAQTGAGISASGEVETLVEAAADLKLVVNDPAGLLPTSELAVYEVQVMNRGSEAARQVKIVVQFGEGVEPIAFEGCEAKIVPGQVVCQPLAQLGAGEQVTMRIKARAGQGGTHQFRVEVTSDDDQMRLVSEGTTKFFAESGRTGSAASTARQPTLVPQGGSFQR
ncbi:MAG: CARDB domain-containing protein, partial [Pirellulaceae bacterium]